MKIGILGGTFDPIHYGHLYIAEYVREEMGLEKIMFMPAGDTPHKNSQLITDKGHRFEMCQSAISDNEKFEISDIEILKSTRSYTLETAKILHAKYPNDDIFFIIGADSAKSLASWYEVRELLRIAKFIVVTRAGVSGVELKALLEGYQRDYGADISLVKAPLYEVSSTMIREFVSVGRSIKYMTPDAVIKTIVEKGLYE